MDVDTPNILKRCSSAPLINESSSTAATSPTTNTAPRNTYLGMFPNNNLARMRRYSGGSSVATSVTLNNWGRLTPRVSQLRAEESLDVCNSREVAHERQVHDALHMEQHCEVLSVGGLHSPTRTPPSYSSSVVSPSPKQNKYTTRRSLSPIPIRPSTFSPGSRGNVVVGKRRWDDTDSPLSKRMCTSDRLTPSTPGTPDSDSLECTFRPVSPRAQPMNESPHESEDIQENHKSPNPS